MLPSGYSKSRDVTILGAVTAAHAGLVVTSFDEGAFQLKSILLSMARRQETIPASQNARVEIVGAEARAVAQEMIGSSVTIRIDDD